MHMAFFGCQNDSRCSVALHIYFLVQKLWNNFCIKMLVEIGMPHLRMVEDGDTIFFLRCKCTIRLCDLLKFYVIFYKIVIFSNHNYTIIVF